MIENENILLQRFVQSGDAEAFSEIVQQHAGLVYGVCLRILADSDRAADATQDTFLQLLRNCGQITGSLSGWLHRAATGKSVDIIRSDSARRRRETKYAQNKPRQVGKWEDLSQYVDRAMDELDGPTKGILIQYFFQGRSMNDIAERLGTSHPTVSRRVKSATDQLRAKLRKWGVIVTSAAMASLLSQNAAQAVPTTVLKELGKIAIVGSPAAVTATSGTGASACIGIMAAAKTKIIIVSAAAVVIVGTAITYKCLSSRNAPSQVRVITKKIEKPSVPDDYRSAVSTEIEQKIVEPVPDMQTDTSSKPHAPEELPAKLQTDEDLPIAEPEDEIDLTTIKGTVTIFTRYLVEGDLDSMAECFTEGADDYDDLRKIMQSGDPKYEKFRYVLESVGLPIEITDTSEDDDGFYVKWNFTVTDSFTIEKGDYRQSYEVGDKLEFDASLKKVGDKYLITGI